MKKNDESRCLYMNINMNEDSEDPKPGMLGYRDKLSLEMIEAAWSPPSKK